MKESELQIGLTFLWFMVDITIVFMGVIAWFINQHSHHWGDSNQQFTLQNYLVKSADPIEDFVDRSLINPQFLACWGKTDDQPLDGMGELDKFQTIP